MARVAAAHLPFPGCPRLECIGYRTSEILERVPAQFRVIEEKREELACPTCLEEGVVIAASRAAAERSPLTAVGRVCARRLSASSSPPSNPRARRASANRRACSRHRDGARWRPSGGYVAADVGELRSGAELAARRRSVDEHPDH
ncbi:IS66 family transposase zinc-finger binding domain-containing protein [Sorangium sp. So ce385]|uniref:IS66 family transposase zinc-finger binding domain-containing protein n=1 Tax=Sorangium sp. So ce385 TaxID=3133308 RepID=UPI003F5BA8D0